MEQEFMKKRNIKYVTNSVVNLMHSGRDKGCLEMLASTAKSETTRNFFTRMRNLHGVWITLEIKGEVGKPRLPGLKTGYIKYKPGIQRLKSYNDLDPIYSIWQNMQNGSKREGKNR